MTVNQLSKIVIGCTGLKRVKKNETGASNKTISKNHSSLICYSIALSASRAARIAGSGEISWPTAPFIHIWGVIRPCVKAL